MAKIQCNIDSLLGKTYHNILLELTLLQNGICVSNLYTFEISCKLLAQNLVTLSHSDIRKEIQKHFLLREDMGTMIKLCTNELYNCNNINEHLLAMEAARYQHLMIMGNKSMYHVEAFLFSIKNQLENNE